MSARDRLSLGVMITAVILAAAALVARDDLAAAFVPARSVAHADGFEVSLSEHFPSREDVVFVRVAERTGRLTHLHRIDVLEGYELRDEVTSYVNTAPVRGVPGASTSVRLSWWDMRAASTHLHVVIDYSRAIGAAAGSTVARERSTARIELDVRTYTARDLFLMRLRVAALSWGCFAIWFFLVLAVARRQARSGEPPRGLPALYPVVALVASAVVGDAVFARPLLDALGQDGNATARLAMLALWIGVPLTWVRVVPARRATAAPWLPTARVRERNR